MLYIAVIIIMSYVYPVPHDVGDVAAYISGLINTLRYRRSASITSADVISYVYSFPTPDGVATKRVSVISYVEVWLILLALVSIYIW